MCIFAFLIKLISLCISLHKYTDDLLRLDAYKKKTLKRYIHIMYTFTFTNPQKTRKNK